MPEPTLEILLATYNGARFLPAQIASLLAQTDQDFRIIVRDDGSQDGTPGLLAEFAAAYPGRLEVVPFDGVNRRACGNFAELLRLSRAPYMMFCDQDDHWHPDKIALSRAAMAALEDIHGHTLPLLVHTDLAVVDEGLAPIAPSRARFVGDDLERDATLARLLMHNVVTGCTMLLNRPLAQACQPVPAQAIIHDWWIALVAAIHGRIAVVPRPLVDYRQHQANAIGAMAMTLPRLVARLAGGRRAAQEAYRRRWDQAEALLAQQAGSMPEPALKQCREFVAMRRRGFFGRRLALARSGFWMRGLVRNIGLLVTL